MNPETSIIMPVFNGLWFVGRTLTSVLNQAGYDDYEVIAIDDASTDGTGLLLEGFGDERIRRISLPANVGPAVARNRGIEAAQGRFIAFIDGDDFWHPRKLARQIAFMKEFGHAFTYTKHIKLDSRLLPTRGFSPPRQLTYQKALRYNPLHTSSVIYDTSQVGKVFMPKLRKRQDYGLWLRILQKTDGFLLPEVLSYYVQREGSVSSNKATLIKYNWLLYRRFAGLSIPKSVYCLSWVLASKALGIK